MKPEWEKGGFAEKEGFKPRVKEWVGDGIPIIISMTISMTVGRWWSYKMAFLWCLAMGASEAKGGWCWRCRQTWPVIGYSWDSVSLTTAANATFTVRIYRRNKTKFYRKHCTHVRWDNALLPSHRLRPHRTSRCLAPPAARYQPSRDTSTPLGSKGSPITRHKSIVKSIHAALWPRHQCLETLVHSSP